MIVIGRSIVHPYITNEYEPFAAEKQQILSIMAGNQEVYSFRTADELSFDLNLRVNIIISALELFQSGFQFRTFQQSFCNPSIGKERLLEDSSFFQTYHLLLPYRIFSKTENYMELNAQPL